MNRDDENRPPSPFRVQEFANTARRLEAERRTARTLVPYVLQTTSASQWPQFVSREDLRTCGALEELGAEASRRLTNNPAQALTIAQLAVTIADDLPDFSYPKIILALARAHAWSALAKVLRFLGRYSESTEASEHALSLLEPFGTLAHDQAIIRFELSVTLGEVERFDESFAIVNQCKALFREYGDTNRLVVCGIAEGVLLQRLQRFREAREIYLLLLASTSDLDPVHRAAIHHAIGFCSIDIGDYATAGPNLEKAIQLHLNLGQTIQASKGQLGRGRLLLRTGQYAAAVAHLRSVRRDFLRNSLTEEAGLCGLEVVEGLLALGRTSEARTLAQKLVNEFILANLNRRAVLALGYLSDAIASNNVSTELAREVHEYVLSLRASPEREFAHQSFTELEQ